MSYSFLRAVSLATSAGLALTVCGALASESASNKDLRSYSCKEIMRFSDADRNIAVALTHGYMMGKKDTTMFDTEAMAKTTDIFIDYCLDNPTEKALQAFERAGESSEKAK